MTEHLCHYCGCPADQLWKKGNQEIWVCRVRSSGNGSAIYVIPWTRCRQWAKTDGYQPVLDPIHPHPTPDL